MRQLIPLLIFCFSFSAASGQQYLIKYDMHDMKAEYFRIGEDTTRVRKLDLKRNGRIVLKVDNYNPFYWDAKVTTYKNTVPDESDYGNAFNPLSFFSKGFGDILGNIPMLDLPKSKGGLSDVNSRFISTASQYAEQYQKLMAISEKVDEFQMVKIQLKELKYDFTKTEGQIKTEARDLVKKTFELQDPTMLTIIGVGKDYTKSLQETLGNLDQLYGQMQQQLPAINGDSRVEGQSFRDIAQKSGSSQMALNKLKEDQQKNPTAIIDETVEVANLYREITNANFHFNYAVNTDPDLAYLKVQFYPKPEIKSKDTMVQYFQVREKRNLKIRNSVGAAFTYFTANNTKYFVNDDSIIQKSGKDLFNPLIATFIHFYSGKTSGFKWGGTFGVGIPLTGEKKDINFLLGLTTAFGQNEPILLSVGLSGAKVNKLTNGYEVGQKTKIRNETDLVTSGYDLGGFISVSFNLNSIGKK
jgi:hypothetical protein